LDLRDLKEILVIRDHKDHREILVLLVLPDRREYQAQRDRKVLQGRVFYLGT
jgi:hypothetical protein